MGLLGEGVFRRKNESKVTESRKPRIGVLGYFGFGNYGDELFLQIWHDLFHDCEIITFSDITGIDKPMHSAPKDRIAFMQSIDVLLIGGGDLIRPAGKNNYWFPEFLEKPVFLYGLGVAKWLGHEKKALKPIENFLSHENIRCLFVRDMPSKAWIRKHIRGLKCEMNVVPDIVFSLSKKELKERGAQKPTLGIITRHQKNYDPERIVQLKKIVELYVSAGFNAVEILASTDQEKDWDIEGANSWGLGLPLKLADTEDDIGTFIAECDVLYSMKFHGCVVGLINHVPSIALLKTNKFTNLYKQLNLTNWLIGKDVAKVELVDYENSRTQLWENIDTLIDYSDVSLKYLRSSMLAEMRMQE